MSQNILWPNQRRRERTRLTVRMAPFASLACGRSKASSVEGRSAKGSRLAGRPFFVFVERQTPKSAQLLIPRRQAMPPCVQRRERVESTRPPTSKGENV